MKVYQDQWTPAGAWIPLVGADRAADVVLAFGAPDALESPGVLETLRDRHRGAPVLACSTAGEISGTRVLDDSVVATAIHFEHTRVRGAEVLFDRAEDSRAAGAQLACELRSDDLVHVLVFSEGVRVNGSELVAGIVDALPPSVSVTGGLAGDGARFSRTLVGWNRAPGEGRVAGIGLYGARLRVGCGSLGGWDAFGPDRRVTRAHQNVLYEVDGESALALYKHYLGEHAAGLPSSALLFPLCLRDANGREGVVRTVLNVREQDGAMIFAGDIPEGAYVRLMKANFDRLIDGATGAAEATRTAIGGTPELAILISCVGRKLVLQQRIEEEVEGVRDVLGAGVPLTRFYSYGEISPFTPTARCELHNQTMTITTLSEVAPG